MDSPRRVARALTRGSGQVATWSILPAVLVVATLFAAAEFAGVAFVLVFLPAFALGGVLAFRIRGRVGARWLLRTLNASPREDWPELIRGARERYLVAGPNSTSPGFFGPDRLTAHDLRRRYRQAEAFAAERREAYRRQPPEVVVADAPAPTRRPSGPGEKGTGAAAPAAADVWAFDRSRLRREAFHAALALAGWVGYGLYEGFHVGVIAFSAFAFFSGGAVKHYRGLKDLRSGRFPLRLDEEGVEIYQDGRVEQVPWRRIGDYHVRVVPVDDAPDDEWLQLQTTDRGTVSLKLNPVACDDLDELRERIDLWRTWAHRERLRVALGGS